MQGLVKSRRLAACHRSVHRSVHRTDRLLCLQELLLKHQLLDHPQRREIEPWRFEEHISVHTHTLNLLIRIAYSNEHQIDIDD